MLRPALRALGIGAALILSPPSAFPEVITVNGTCTLVDAIVAANTDAVAGACVAGSGADTIVLTVPVTLTAVDHDLNGPNGLPSVTSEITIEGNGLLIERDGGAPAFRVMHVASTGDLTLRNTTVSGGRSPAGGGIFNAEGLVSLVNSTVSGNTATDASGFMGYAYYYGSYGGGIFNRLGTLTLDHSTVSGNTSTDVSYSLAGGIYNSGLTYLENSTVSNNSVATALGGYGGGIANVGSLSIRNSTISGNTGTSTIEPVMGYYVLMYGGGIANFGFTTITNGTVSGNTVTANDTVTPFAYAYGGGVFSNYDVTLTNATLSSNTATSSVTYGFSSGGNLQDWSVSDATNSILGFGSPDNCVGLDTFSAALSDDGSCGFAANLTGLDSNLTDNGGPTETHALLMGSTAIDLAGACGESEDQRGAGRVGDCDSGSFEYIGCSPLVLANRVITTVETWETCHTAELGSFLEVLSGGHLTIVAGSKIVFHNDSSFSSLEAGIDPDLQVMSPESLMLQGRSNERDPSR